MKAIITGLVLFLATGAFAQRHTGGAVTGTPTVTNATHKGVKGTVTSFDGRACNFHITITENGKNVGLVPINLPAEFNQDGLTIVFDYLETKDEISQGCGYRSAISVSNVKIARP